MRIEQGFQQTPFPRWHPYDTDLVLPQILKRILPADAFQEVSADLERFGSLVNGPIRELNELCSDPKITQYDNWGRRTDKLHTSEGWRELKKVAIKEGLVAIFYERKFGEYSRVWGFAKSFIFQGDSNVVMCPLSMTDGAARVIELLGTADMKARVFPRLTSRDPSQAYISGQWMTERPGGSDVSQTETTATEATHPSGLRALGPVYNIDGFKWFSSATDADMAVALARTGDRSLGSRSLSLFLVPMRFPFAGVSLHPQLAHSNNGIEIHRLKNKLGTRLVPTAELSLNATTGFRIGDLNAGVKSITPVLNITRLHSAITSVGCLSRCLSIARAYASVRIVDHGKHLLRDVPVHTATLAKVSLLYRALAHLVFGVVHLLGRVETGVASPAEEARLRLLTAVAKGFAAHKACGGMEECMAALGGEGYMEENIISRLIRDCLVEKIWEGTINVLSLELIKGAHSNPLALKSLAEWSKAIIDSVPPQMERSLSEALSILRPSIQYLLSALKPPVSQLVPRPALILFGHVFAALYLLEHSVWSSVNDESEKEIDMECFRRWVVEEGLVEATEEVKRIVGSPEDGGRRTDVDSDIVYGKAKL
ncbi:hypothetical protein SISNIDRAFT_480264 [Sistotremastrum niveocremeum HHB9708]|uniref:Acyl-CoA dehydrogenase NM domain-like protein n=1 Tax=Sistotremastrum niveocremeum HHB9708 TaxID=1314777 RepID=A0A164MQT0_9AGAM|nr:hypothetical protein SISNIDRAFT_480264 [Sistotremastrum niveocremeum HHB9708]